MKINKYDLKITLRTLQKLQMKARKDDRRSDAQHYADTQLLIQREIFEGV